MAHLNLVTGAGGFLGAHLTRLLLERGETVRGLDLEVSNIPGAADKVTASVTDEAAMARAMEGVDFVFHTAANPFLWARDKLEYDEVNVAGTNIVLEAAAEADVKRVVHVSSATTLVGRKTPRGASSVNESVELGQADMLGPYPLSKRRAEIAALQAAGHGLETVIVMPTLPIGPGDHRLTAPTRMIMDLVNRKVPATLDCMLCLVDVRDVAKGCVLARDKGRSGTRYLLGGDNLAMADFLKQLADASGVRMPRFHVPYALARGAASISEWISTYITKKMPKAPVTGVRLAGRKVSFDSSRARQELGFAPRPLDETLADTLAWLKRTRP